VPGFLFLEEKQLGHETDYIPPPAADVKNTSILA
jgi:hypothetical protein